MNDTQDETIGLHAWIGANPHTGDRMPCMLAYPVVPPGAVTAADEPDLARKLADVIGQSWGLTLGEFYPRPVLGDIEPVLGAGQDDSCWTSLAGIPLHWPADPQWAAVLRERGYACVCVTARRAPRLICGPLMEVWREEEETVAQGVTLLIPLFHRTVPGYELVPQSCEPSTQRIYRDAVALPTVDAIRRAARVRGELEVPMDDAYAVILPGGASGPEAEIAATRILRDLTGVGPADGTCYSCGCPDNGTHTC